MGVNAEPTVRRFRGLLMEPAHPDDGYALGPSLRQHDLEELRLCWNGTEDPGFLLSKSIETSEYSFVISTEEDKVIHAVWGHGNWLSGNVRSGLAYVWLLADDNLFEKYGWAMTAYARRYIFPLLDELYGVYGNFVMSKNLVHCRWLLRSGFRRAAHSYINDEKFSLYLRYGNNYPHRRSANV